VHKLISLLIILTSLAITGCGESTPPPRTAEQILEQKNNKIFLDSECWLVIRRIAREIATHDFEDPFVGVEPTRVIFGPTGEYIFSGADLKFQNDFGVWTKAQWQCKVDAPTNKILFIDIAGQTFAFDNLKPFLTTPKQE
jgi:hypothetical protein